MDSEQERSRLGCILLLSYIRLWRELLFVTLPRQVQKPLYSNIQLAYAFFVYEF